ncbi:MAG: ArsR family transcriptional regulator [bacterium]
MLNSLITSETRIRLLLKFFLNPSTRRYLRQLANEFGESTNGIRIELNKLTNARILDMEKDGRSKIYKANTDHPLFSEIRQIVLKSTGIDKVISNIIDKAGDIHMAFIRGDYAVGNDSGLIDLVVVGDDMNTAEINRVRKKTEDLIGRKISLLLLTIEEYKNLKLKFNKENLLILFENSHAQVSI